MDHVPRHAGGSFPKFQKARRILRLRPCRRPPFRQVDKVITDMMIADRLVADKMIRLI